MDSSSHPDTDTSCKKQGQREHKVHIVYSCNECDIQCQGKTAFNRHMKSHITFKCPACEKVYQDRHLFKYHLSDHEKHFHCNQCVKRFSRVGNLNRHIIFQHQDEKDTWKNELNRAKIHEYNGCIDEARDLFMLLLQKKSRNKVVCKEFADFEERLGNYKSALKLTKVLTKGLKPKLRCALCSHEARTKSNLEQHTKFWHVEKVGCKKCLQDFDDRLSLKNHDVACVGYKCNILGCMYTAKFAAWMKKHKKNHGE